MHRRRVMFGFWSLIFFVPALSTFGQDKTAEAILQSKGLSRVGTYYLLDADIKLPEWFRNMRMAQNKVETSMRKRAYIEKDMEAAEATMEDLDQQNRALTSKLESTSKKAVGTYNWIVDQVNAVRSKLREGEAYLKKRQQDLSEVGDPSDEYVTNVLKFSDMMENLGAQYEKLAADPEVQDALNHLNQSLQTKVKLGPSVRFNQELPGIRKLRETVNSAAIKLVFEGGVPMVAVVIKEPFSRNWARTRMWSRRTRRDPSTPTGFTLSRSPRI